MLESVGTPTLYLSFTAFVVVMLAIDFFGLKTSGDHKISTKEAAIWSLIWISVALAFGGWFYWYLEGIAGPVVAKEKALEYITGYLIENRWRSTTCSSGSPYSAFSACRRNTRSACCCMGCWARSYCARS